MDYIASSYRKVHRIFWNAVQCLGRFSDSLSLEQNDQVTVSRLCSDNFKYWFGVCCVPVSVQVEWELAIPVWGSEIPNGVTPTVLVGAAVNWCRVGGHAHLLPGQRVVLPNVMNAGIKKRSPVSPLRYIMVFSWENKKVELWNLKSWEPPQISHDHPLSC